MEKEIQIINGKPRIVCSFFINWNGKQEKVKIKKLSFGEYNDVQKSSTKISMLGNVPKFELDQTIMNEQAICKSVIEAPFTLNDINAVRDLDREEAEFILANINELNNPTDKKKES
jgi:hypothetical protein